MGNLEQSESEGTLPTGSVEDDAAITFQHEIHHDTDEEFIKDLRDKREGQPNNGIDPHQNIRPQEDEVIKEIRGKEQH